MHRPGTDAINMRLPRESQHKRATVGLDILAAIGSDIALMQLNGIAQSLKFKALQERAKKKLPTLPRAASHGGGA
ncbi:hypothetical protein ACNKHT_13750 [Shigella flexneri]